MQDSYERIADTILDALDQGIVPWRKPWRASTDGPRSVDGRPYRGINVFLLLWQAQAKGYGDPRWITFKKALDLGGNVRKGEKGTAVVLWKRQTVKDNDPDTGKERTKVIPLIRTFTVFNVAQCDGLTLKPLGGPVNDREPIEAAEAVLTNMPNRPVVQWDGGNQAYYVPSLDEVHMPARFSFNSDEEVYSTLFHEIVHSTGHPSRCNRRSKDENHAFGSHDYGREELVAEMGSAFLCGETGILPATLTNSAAYIGHWVAAINEDKKAVVVAAAQAQKAVDYILGRTFEEKPEDEQA